MKICHLTSAHDAEDVRIFHKECISLAKAGYEVYLVARGDSYDKNGVHIVGVGEIPGNRLKRMTQGAKAVYRKALELDCDIYHFHDPELLPYGLKLKRKGKKVIFDSHENSPAQIREKVYLPKTIRTIVAFLYEAVQSYVVRRIDAVVVPCTFCGKNIFDGIARRTAFVNNYPLLDELYEKYDSAISPEGYVCYVGTMSEINGTSDLVIASMMAGAPLVLAGPSDYIERLSALPEYVNVTYKGFVNRQEVCEIYQHASVGVYVNRHFGQNGMIDTFGVKVYEFMAMGLPIVVDSVRYSEAVIKKYSCGLCVPAGDIDATATAIRYLLDNPDEAKRMGENGRRAIKEEFNWATQETKLLKLYEVIMKA